MTMLVRKADDESAFQLSRDALIRELRERKRNGTVIRLEDFSFKQSQEALKDVDGSIADLLLQERDESY